MTPTLGQPPQVAEGVYRLGTRWANFYLVVEDDAGLLIDTGYPGYRDQIDRAAAALGLPPAAIEAVIVTHHHVDHAGTAEGVRSRFDATVIVGEADAPIVRGERPSHPPQGFWSQGWRPSMIRYLLHSARAGGARYRPVTDLTTLDQDRTLDLPGRPRVIPTPGHTAGHCAVLLEQRGVLLAGDAMVNFDYATGKRGLGLHRFNEDRRRALASLGSLEGIEAELVLFGHGDAWSDGLGPALEIVRERG